MWLLTLNSVSNFFVRGLRDHCEYVSAVDGISVPGFYLAHCACYWRAYLVFHLHCLENEKKVSGLDTGSCLYCYLQDLAGHGGFYWCSSSASGWFWCGSRCWCGCRRWCWCGCGGCRGWSLRRCCCLCLACSHLLDFYLVGGAVYCDFIRFHHCSS